MIYRKQDKPQGYSFASRENLQSCDEDLSRLFMALAEDGWNISVICGHRGERAQNIAFKDESSPYQWPDSNHNLIPSMAVDATPYIPGIGIPWDDRGPWYVLAGAVQQKAHDLGIRVKWGGYFSTMFDGPHWEIEL